ncbi:hypothetical protein JZ751_006947 [Albula glossodonta]|uniref:Ig-like domain-containing protein n=1 Tax=Albula glossodonta TaxID=121402 RepID=A0A8T2P4J9_9TELE|nr:hypothetical protein JZ751_006947 [Albula glossodonta]
MGWFKQSIGKMPQCIVTSYSYSQDATFYEGFKNSRFEVVKGNRELHLKISGMKPEDVATYYCGNMFLNHLQFGNGTFLMLKGSESNSRTVIQQPVSEPLQPGDSVTLQCSVHTETCAGEHSVYWFRQASGESLPGIIYTHGNRSDQCERSSGAGSPTQSCVYKLPKRNLGRSDAGTYYCAVATCGEILFGNGIKLDIEDCSQPPRDPKTGATVNQNQGTELNYASVSFTHSKSQHRKKEKNSRSAEYSEVRYLQQD